MPIKLSPHAKLRLKQRKISKSLLYRTVANPDDVIVQERNRKLLIGKYGNEKLIVAVIEKGRQIVVLSLWYD